MGYYHDINRTFGGAWNGIFNKGIVRFGSVDSLLEPNNKFDVFKDTIKSSN